jgi:hypothetical protein
MVILLKSFLTCALSLSDARPILKAAGKDEPSLGLTGSQLTLSDADAAVLSVDISKLPPFPKAGITFTSRIAAGPGTRHRSCQLILGLHRLCQLILGLHEDWIRSYNRRCLVDQINQSFDGC